MAVLTPSTTAAVTEADWRALFDAGADLTLGIEEELMLLDPRTLDLLPEAAEIVAACEDPRFRTDMPASQIEIVSPVCRSLPDLETAVRDARAALATCVDGWARLAASGTHAFAAGSGPLTPAPRYAALDAEFGSIARRQLVFGLHVHVGLRGADRALAVLNAVRSYLPELAALAGNAPFRRGLDTGLASVRPKLAELLPRQGVPPVFERWSDLAELVAWGRAGGAFDQPSRLWWEVRAHGTHGTLEIRVPDQQVTAAESAAVAAVVASLVGWLAARHDAGERLPVHDAVRIAENRWRAARHGLAGTLLDLDTGAPRPTRERLGELIDTVAPAGERIGAEAGLEVARTLLCRNGAERQRAIATEHGVRAVVEWQAGAFLA